MHIKLGPKARSVVNDNDVDVRGFDEGKEGVQYYNSRGGDESRSCFGGEGALVGEAPYEAAADKLGDWRDPKKVEETVVGEVFSRQRLVIPSAGCDCDKTIPRQVKATTCYRR